MVSKMEGFAYKFDSVQALIIVCVQPKVDILM